MQPPQQPGYYPPQQPPQRPRSTLSQRITAMSAGSLALFFVGPLVLIVLCCGVDIAGGVFNSIFGGGIEATPTP